MRPPLFRLRGFTLIEMMVAIAVLVLLLMAVMPSAGRWMDNSRIRGTAQSLQAGIEMARNEAVRRNQNVSFWLVELTEPSVLGDGCTLSGTSPSWVVSMDAPTGHCGEVPSNTVSPRIVTGRAAGQAGSRVSVTAMKSSDGTAGGTTVTFNGFGRPVAGTANAIGRIDVTGLGSDIDYVALRLLVSAAGQVRICDPRATADGDPRKCLP